jgi:hypothetical protein
MNIFSTNQHQVVGMIFTHQQVIKAVMWIWIRKDPKLLVGYGFIKLVEAGSDSSSGSCPQVIPYFSKV